MATTVTMLPEQVRGNTSAQLNVPGGAPTSVKFKMISSVYPTNAALTWDFVADQSFDGGTNFSQWFARIGDHGGGQGVPGKFGVPGDGLPEFTMSYDGTARIARVTITVNQSFSWGLTGTIV